MRTPVHLFDQLVSVHRPEVSMDDTGSAVTTWPAHRIDIPARLMPLPGSRPEHFGRAGSLRRWRVYMPGDAEVRSGDRLLWKGQGMDVVSVVNVHEQNRFLIIDAQEIQPS